MIVAQLPVLGVLYALTSASGNVLGEVLRKRLVGHFSPGVVTWAYRLPTALFIGAIIFVMARHGAHFGFADRGPLFGVSFLHVTPPAEFAAYMVVVTLLIGSATWAHLKAFQVGELSTTAPLLSFTPVFAIFTTWIAFHQYPSTVKLMGVLLVVAGAFAIHLDVFSNGWLDPIKALFRDPGSRWMLLVCVLYAISSPIERSADDISGPYTEAMILAFGTSLMWLLVGVARRENVTAIFSREPWRLLLLSSSDAIVLVTYYASLALVPPFIVQTLRRADLLVIVIMGWLVFKERNIARKFFGCSIMVVGVWLIVVNNLSLEGAAIIASVGLAILLPLSALAVSLERRKSVTQHAAR